MDYQKFRFCMTCQRQALIKEKRCAFCEGDFILDSPKPDRYLANITEYNKQKKQKQDELLQH
tara:strand:- start:3836 stop:4021 length:186 start_codon:yes stop_codon:yes gene_type:complete